MTEITKKPTHWMDYRGYVLTDKDRTDRGGDWEHFYNIPCLSVRGKVKPLHKCSVCNGKGSDPDGSGYSCPSCGITGGQPESSKNSSFKI